MFNPHKSLKTTCTRRSDGSLTSKPTDGNRILESSSSKSISLPPSPTVTSILSAGSSNSWQNCRDQTNNSFIVEANSESEKELLIKIRDELRTSPLLKSMLEEKMRENYLHRKTSTENINCD